MPSPYPRFGRLRRVRGGDDDEVLAQHLVHVQARGHRPEVEGPSDEREVELPGTEGLDEFARALLHDLEFDSGMLGVEAAERLGDEAHAQGRSRPEADPALPQTGEFVHVEADRLGVGEHPPRSRQQRLAGCGEGDVPAGAMEELGPELLLQGRDLPGQGGLGEMEGRGGLREVPGVGDLDEACELFEIHSNSLLLSC